MGSKMVAYATIVCATIGLPELVEDYIAMVKGVVSRHYHDVTRYTSNTFLRVKLGEALEKGSIAPHLYETASEAEASLPVVERN